MMTTPMAWLGLTLGLACAAPALSGTDYTAGISGAEVQRLVVQALTDAGQSAEGIEAPLRAYPACEVAPAITAHLGDWSTVDLTCPAPQWVRAFRIKAAKAGAWTATDKAQTAEMRPAVVLTRSLSKGTTLQAADLVLADVPALGADTVFSDPAQLVGRVLTVHLGEGQRLQPRHLAPDYLVRKDGPVAITAGQGGFAVGMAGVALEDGEIGAVVLVRNLSSNRELRAIVAGPQIVTVATNIN